VKHGLRVKILCLAQTPYPQLGLHHTLMERSIHSSPVVVDHSRQLKPLCYAAFRVLSCTCGEAEDAPPQAPQWHLLHSQLRHLADRLVGACRFPSLPCINKAAVPCYSCHFFDKAAVPSCPCSLVTKLLCCPVQTDHLLGFTLNP